MKNPFKFVKNKPPYKKLYSTLQKYFTEDYREFSTEDLAILAFFWLSEDFLVRKDQVGTSAMYDNFKMIAQRLNYFKDSKEVFFEYVTYIPNPYNIHITLYATVMNAQMSTGVFKQVFDIDEEKKIAIIVRENLKGLSETCITTKLKNKDKILSCLTEVIKLSDDNPTTRTVHSKKELEDLVFTDILQNFAESARFRYEPAPDKIPL